MAPRRRPGTARQPAPGDAATEGRGKVFWTGRSQAIRIPRAFRVSTAEVKVRRDGSSLVLEPIEVDTDEKGWPLAFWELAGSAPDFDLGDRSRSHERGDVLGRPRGR
jgi:virulence-associated protein VagC